MKVRHLTAGGVLALAFLLSLLLHLATLGSGVLSFDAIAMPDDPKLRQLSAKLQSMAFDEPPPPALSAPRLPGTLGAGEGEASQPAAEAPRKPPRRKPAPAPVASAAVAQAPMVVATAPQREASSVVAQQPASAAVAQAPAAEAEAATVKPERPIRAFPAQARIQFSLLYSGVLVGQAHMDWQRDGDGYRLDTEVRPAIGPRVRYQTSGTVGKRGLRPERFEGSRNGEVRERAEFDWAAGELRYGDRQLDKREALEDGAQDWLGLGVQLALRGDAMDDAPTQITTGKKVYRMLLKPDGETDFDTGDGVIRAVVVRVKQPEELYEFWLAPDFANIPIRVLRVNKDARMEMRASLIELAGNTVWKQPPRKQISNESKR